MKKIQFGYSKVPNMGDLLNELLMERVFNVPYVNAKYIYQYEVTGIGSFLDDLFTGPEKERTDIRYRIKKVAYQHCLHECNVWGTGFLTDLSNRRNGLARNNVNFIAVRGRKTKESIERIINTSINPMYGDGGIITPLLLEKPIEKKYSMGIIPHFREKNSEVVSFLHEKYPEALMIDLQKDPMSVIKEISECEYIISSSLHGLIVADAFRIPNIRVYMTDAPLGDGFKFDDYYSAYELTNPAVIITSVKSVPSVNSIIDQYQVTDKMVDKMKSDMLTSMEICLKK